MTGLTLSQKIGYGSGHVLNDICYCLWSTYVLLFFHEVIHFNNNYAGYVELLGQLADGFSIILVGVWGERPGFTFRLCRTRGQKKSCHLMGTMFVLTSFPFIFGPCLGCEEWPDWAQLLYYALFATIFHFGSACVQISHLSLIPVLAGQSGERTQLTAIRNAMTCVSNIAVYLVVWAVLGRREGAGLSEKDVKSFRYILLATLGPGALASLAFQLVLRESGVTGANKNGSQYSKVKAADRSMRILREPQFYQVAGLYGASRLVVSLSLAYLPLYMSESLQLTSRYVAIVPLVLFTSSFVSSCFIGPLARRVGIKTSYLLGAAMVVAACCLVRYCGAAAAAQQDDWFSQAGIFVVAVLLGFAGALLSITSLGLTTQFIGPNIEDSGMVFSAVGLTDSISVGLAVMTVQQLIPCDDGQCSAEERQYFRDVLFYAVGGAAVLGGVCLLLLPVRVGKQWQVEETQHDPEPKVDINLPTIN